MTEMQFESEIDIVKDLIKGYGREVTLGELLDDLIEMVKAEGLEDCYNLEE